MSKIDELTEKYCPDGVEYKEMGELGKFYGGLTGKKKEDFIDGNANFISYVNVYKNLALDLNDTAKVQVSPNEKQRKLKYLDVVFTGSSETPDECAFSSVVCEEPQHDYYLNSFCFVWELNDKSLFNPHFLKHLFRSDDLRYQLGRTASGVTRFNVSKEKMKKIKIPVPPIEVQEEIVRILDNFTELTAELTAELTVRKQQYEYYREQLYIFDTLEINYKPVCKIKKLSYWLMPATPNYINEGVPYITSKNIKNAVIDFSDVKYTSKEDYLLMSTNRQIQKNDLLITMIGTIGEMAFVGDFTEFYGQNMYLLRIDEAKVNRKYLYYYMTSPKVKDGLVSKKNASSQGYIKAGSIENLIIPLPPIEKQKEIVENLDKFSNLCEDISEGLPAEIEARQKQYEYYRNKLLNFKEKKI